MQSKSILFLSRSDILCLGSLSRLCVDAIENGLVRHAARQFVQPLKPYLRWRGAGGHIADRIIAMPAYLGGGEPVAGIKWIGSKHDNPARHGLERASALTILNDVDTHYPIAILEGGLLSGLRTAAVSAVAAKHLARSGFTDLTLIGCGAIARAHVEMFLDELPSIARVHLFDLDRGAAQRLQAALDPRNLRADVCIHATAEAAIRQGQVVIPCTVADRPYIRYEWLGGGAFLCNVSIMDVHKEVFLQVDKVVVDDWDQCNREKKVIHQLVEEGRFSREMLHAELGEIVAGKRPGRERDDEIILLNPMGMAVEDMACAHAVYRAALAAQVGTWLSLD